jgi:hypothetical protein
MKRTLLRLVSLLVMFSLVFSFTGSASAAYPDGIAPAAARMAKLGLIQGRGGDPTDLGLSLPITRAELVTVIVRAYGFAEDAKFLKGTAAFPDTANHWASGEIAIANNLIRLNGFTMGLPDGRFDPDGSVTPAQAVAFLVKFLGVPFDASKPWPDAYYDAAVAARLITHEDRIRFTILGEAPAPRGLVFYVADNGFSSYKLPDGKTIYTKYVKTTPPTLTLDTIPESTRDSRFTMSGSVSSDVTLVTVNGVPAAVTNARFSRPVDLSMGENRFSIVATDLVGNTATQEVKITRGAGVPASIEAPLTMTVGIGKTVDLPITVKDAAGNVIADAPVSVTSEWGTWAAGRFTTGNKIGSGTITVKSGDLTRNISVTITAGALAKIVITPATTELMAGARHQFTATGQDQFGNQVPLPGNVVWSASKGVISPNGDFGATWDTSGTVTITARVGDVTGTATVTVFGQYTRITASAPTGLVANGASKGQLAISVVDAAGNVSRNYTGVVTVITSNPSIATVASNSVQITNGVGSVEITAGTVPGTATISLSGTNLTGAVAMVTTVGPAATSMSLSADPGNMAADNRSSTVVTAVLIDQTGNPVRYTPGGNYTVDFVTSDPTMTIVSPAVMNGIPMSYDGQASKFQAVTRFYARNNIGAVSVTATLKKDGLIVTSASTTISTMLVGVPYRLTMDQVFDAPTAGPNNTQRVTVRVLDVNGNQVTSAGSSVGDAYIIQDLVLTKNAGASAVLPTVVGSSNAGSWSGGKAVFSVTDSKAEAVTYTATATWNGITLAAATGTGHFVSGTPSRVTLEASPKVLNANGISTSTLTARITDNFGNPVTEGSYPVTFRRVSGSAMAGWTDSTVYSINGVAAWTVRAGTNLGTDTFRATVPLSSSLTVWAEDTVTATIMGAPNQLRFAGLTPSPSGTDATIRVNVLDATGTQIVTYDNSTVVTLNVTGPDNFSQSYSVTDVNGVATFTVRLDRVGSYTLKATAAGLRGATGATGDNAAAVQLVTAGAAAGVRLTTNLTSLSADNASMALITATLVDAQGNPATANATSNLDGLSLTSGNNTYLVANGGITFYEADGVTVTADPAKKAIAKAYFRATSQPGSVSITAQRAGLTNGVVTINTIFGGFTASRLAVATDSDRKVTVDPAAKQLQMVKVTLHDHMGNRVTNPGPSAYVKLTASGTGAIAIFLDPAGTQPYVEGAVNRPQFTIMNGGEVAFWVTNTKAETVEYRAELYNAAIGGTASTLVSAGSASGSFMAGDPFQIGLVGMPFTVRGDGSSVAVVTASVQDRNGNPVNDSAGTVKVRIPPTQGFTHAYIEGGSSDGWYTASVANGQAVIIVRSRYTTNTSDVYMEADYWAAGAASATLHTNPVRVLVVGAGSDTVAPAVASVSTTRQNNGVVTAGDTFAITFNEPTNRPALTAASFILPAGKSLGVASYTWNPEGTVLTITAGAGVNLAQGDTVKFAATDAVTDTAANPFGLGVLFTVDVTAPAITNVTVNRSVPGAMTAGDTYVLTFSEPTRGPALTNASFATTSGGKFGDTAQFAWNGTNTVLTITVGTGGTLLQNGDAVAFASANIVTDAAGVGAGTGAFLTIDLNALTVTNVRVNRSTDEAFRAGDTIVITFSRATTAPALTAAAFDVRDSASAARADAFGAGAQFQWSVGNTVLTITGAGTPTLQTGDTVRLAAGGTIKDTGANPFGTGLLWTADLTAPRASSVAVTRATDGVFAADDTIVISFDEPTSAPANLTEADLIVRDSQGAERVACNCFGTGATFVWNAAKTKLTITGKGTPGLQTGDTVAFRSGTRITDAAGLGFGTGLLFTADVTAPVVESMTVTRAVNGQFTAGDTIKLTFAEPTNAPALLNADLVIKDASDNTHSFAASTFVWNAQKTVLTITAAGTPTVQTGDTVKLLLPDQIRDAVGLPVGDGVLFTVDLSTATVTTAVAANANGAPGAGVIEAGDTITLTFDKAFDQPADPNLAAGDIVLSAGSFGTGATAHWTDDKHLVITLGTAPTLTGGETISFSAAYAAGLTDEHGMKAGTALVALPAATEF